MEEGYTVDCYLRDSFGSVVTWIPSRIAVEIPYVKPGRRIEWSLCTGPGFRDQHQHSRAPQG